MQEKETGRSEIIHLVIDENFQRQGLGKLISEVIIKRLKSQNYARIYVAVSAENKEALLFWKKVNFVETELKNYDEDIIFELKV